jgi:hypothetical protein
MSGTADAAFEVECPCCGSTLQVDVETRSVIHHREPVRKAPIEDLQAAVQQLKGEADRRNDIFEKSFASHLTGALVREKKFEELLKQAKEDPVDKPPKRPFDLD